MGGDLANVLIEGNRAKIMVDSDTTFWPCFFGINLRCTEISMKTNPGFSISLFFFWPIQHVAISRGKQMLRLCLA